MKYGDLLGESAGQVFCYVSKEQSERSRLCRENVEMGIGIAKG